MRMPRKLVVALSVCCLLAGAIVTAPAAGATAFTCSDVDLPVSGPGLPVLLPPTPSKVHGRLCLPDGPAPDAVQLLVHGGTYNSAYWDLPFGTGQYSYQRDMAAHGLATFAPDRLGTGQSSKPASLPLTLAAEAESMHQVITHLRAGHVGGIPFARVVIVGHSVGSGIVAAEASTYHDVDGVVLSGMTHIPAVPVLLLGVVFGLLPAFADPALSALGSDPLYFTTRAGARSWLFYAEGDSDPAVIAADEATKDQVSVPGMGTVAVFGIVLPATLGINVPVFQAVGEKDVLFCGVLALRDCSNAQSLRAQEAPYYSPAAQLSTFVLPGAGHSLGLHLNAGAYRDATRDWLRDRLGVVA